MVYRMDMSQEKEKDVLLPEGWREFRVVNVEEKTSTKGNPMFVWTLEDDETKQNKDVYAIATLKKRWFLKQLLKACDVIVENGEIYLFELKNLKDKFIYGRIKHIEETFINKEGNEQKVLKAKIVEIKKQEETAPF